MDEMLGKLLYLSADAASKVEEIHIQLLFLQRQCNFRDRPLCDTLKVKTFEELMLTDKLETVGFIRRLQNYLMTFEDLRLLSLLQLNNNPTLQRIARMKRDDIHDNDLIRIAEELSIAKKSFRSFAKSLHQTSSKQSNDIFKHLTKMRDELNSNVNKLSSVVKSLTDKIGKIWAILNPTIESFTNFGYFFWLVVLTACASTIVVTLFLLVPLSCSCCHVDNFASVTFVMASVVIVIFSVFLGFFIIAVALIGGNGEIFACRVLFETPHFTVLSKVFDNPGIIYENPPVNGIFHEILISSEQSDFHFANTSLPTVLNECEKDQSTYFVFQFEKMLNLSYGLDFKNFHSIVNSINNIEASSKSFSTLTRKTQCILDELLNDINSSFTSYQSEISRISPDKEMSHFIDQMQRVSIQIVDSSTKSRMATLTATAKRIQTTILQPLELLKNEVVFHLTALELHMNPWIVQLKTLKKNLNHTQNYLNDKDFAGICARYSESFRERLRLSLENFKNETLSTLEHGVGCRPLFDVFNGIRWFICGHIINSINGEFFAIIK